MEAGYFLAQFRARLQDELGLAPTEIGRWSGARPSSANLLQLKLASGVVLLYVKVRSNSSGFWGLNRGRLRALASSGRQWRVVLLLGPGEDSYLLTPAEVARAQEAHRWSISGDDYKVHAGRELHGVAEFERHADLIAAIAGAAPSAKLA